MEKIKVLVLLLLFSGSVSSQDMFVGESEFGVGDYHVSCVPYSGLIRLVEVNVVEDVDFGGFKSTWMFKYKSLNGKASIFEPSEYSGIDIGSCLEGGWTDMYFYPNPFYGKHYVRKIYRVKLLRSSLDDDGHRIYGFLTKNGKEFMIEKYSRKWMYKLILPIDNGYMIYQIVSHKNKLK